MTDILLMIALVAAGGALLVACLNFYFHMSLGTAVKQALNRIEATALDHDETHAHLSKIASQLTKLEARAADVVSDAVTATRKIANNVAPWVNAAPPPLPRHLPDAPTTTAADAAFLGRISAAVQPVASATAEDVAAVERRLADGYERLRMALMADLAKVHTRIDAAKRDVDVSNTELVADLRHQIGDLQHGLDAVRRQLQQEVAERQQEQTRTRTQLGGAVDQLVQRLTVPAGMNDAIAKVAAARNEAMN